MTGQLRIRPIPKNRYIDWQTLADAMRRNIGKAVYLQHRGGYLKAHGHRMLRQRLGPDVKFHIKLTNDGAYFWIEPTVAIPTDTADGLAEVMRAAARHAKANAEQETMLREYIAANGMDSI